MLMFKIGGKLSCSLQVSNIVSKTEKTSEQFSMCMLKLLPEVSTLPSLVMISIMKEL